MALLDVASTWCFASFCTDCTDFPNALYVVALEIALTFHVRVYLNIIISALDTPVFEGSDPNVGPVATRATISTSLQTSWPRTFALLRKICGTLWYGDVLDSHKAGWSCLDTLCQSNLAMNNPRTKWRLTWEHTIYELRAQLLESYPSLGRCRYTGFPHVFSNEKTIPMDQWTFKDIY